MLLIDSMSVDGTLAGLARGRQARRGRRRDGARGGGGRAALGGTAPARRTLLVFGTPESFTLMTAKTWVGDLAARVGLRNLASEVGGPERHPGFVEVNDEVLAGLDPELVLLVSHGAPEQVRDRFARALPGARHLAEGREPGAHPRAVAGALLRESRAAARRGRGRAPEARRRSGEAGPTRRGDAAERDERAATLKCGDLARALDAPWRARVALWRARTCRTRVRAALVGGRASAASVLVAAGLGAVGVPWRELPRALADPAHPAHVVLWQIRLPRIAAGVLVGAALATAGALLQAVVRNPLADPGDHGRHGRRGSRRPDRHPAAARAIATRCRRAPSSGGLGATAVVLGVAWTGRGLMVPLRIMLSGVAVQALLFSAVALLTYAFADRAPAFVASRSARSPASGGSDVGSAFGRRVVGVALALASTRALNLLLLDDASAERHRSARRAARGSAPRASRRCSRPARSASRGSSASSAWSCRTRCGSSPGPIIACCCRSRCSAAPALVVLADAGARTVAAPLELPVGALLALIGGPYFLVELWRRVV